MLWAYLYFPSLQLDGVVTEGGRDWQPVVILDGNNNEIVQLNAQAKQSGLRLGMGLATAVALEHQLQVLPYCQQQERQTLTFIAEQLYQVSSDIALDSPNGLYLRIENMLALYGDLSGYWQNLQSVLQPLQLSLHYATAYSPSAAKVLARAKVDRLLTEQKKVLSILNSLSINSLALDQKVQKQLDKIGAKTIGQLLSLPKEQLSQRFDSSVTHYLRRLVNGDDLPMVFYQPQGHFFHYLELLYEINDSNKLLFPIKSLLSLLANYLKKADLLSDRLVITLFLRNQPSKDVVINSAEAIYQASQWLSLTELTLASLQLAAPVVAISLTCKRFSSQQQQSGDFFSLAEGKYTRQRLLSLLLAKLGQSRVHSLLLTDDYRPECANGYAPINLVSQRKIKTEHFTRLRPSYLLPEPLALATEIAVFSSPERIETAWWENTVKRDYFIGRNPYGQWCWLYRQADHRWFIHGYFA
ncbi:nucleotidyltransferase [Thalassotalea insulae]|uniref:Nucleotidyltransferase n=1 Tax=Thalassotalea insulae TaxID=2056778 RepID=A0ABQ6GPQ3_9GAMM|nr:DNA polymerase Y family protein [Thalassotalea insulae]GLX77907.1 nucleotidyltransferase [Thalassotalea insulae]